MKNSEIESDDDVKKYTIPRSYIAKGFYADQLKIWLKLFKSEQLFITSTEDFESNTENVLNKIYDFLEIPQINLKNLGKHKVASYPPMKDETRKFLVDLYKIHNDELFRMISNEFDWNK